MICLHYSGGKRRPLILTVAFCALLTTIPINAGVLDDTSGGAKSSSANPKPQLTQTESPQAPVSQTDTVSSPSISQAKELKPVPSVGVNGNGPYDKLALALAQSSGADGKINVSIGNFLDGDSDQLSPRSTEVKEELAIALPKTGKFEIITREHLADLQNEGKFQSSDIVQPGAGSKQVAVKAVNGIIRGRITSKPDGTVVYASIAYLDGGEIREVKSIIPGPDTAKEKPAKVAVVQQSQTGSPAVTAEGGRRGKRHQETQAAAVQSTSQSQKPGHLLLNLINKREERLENQLKHGVTTGKITPWEAAEIRDGIQKIKRQENRFLLQNDGFLTKSERDQLNAAEDQLAQQISKNKKANRHN